MSEDLLGPESQCLDRKSLRIIVGKTADFAELAKDCVCFANGSGGQLLIGIEDGAVEPPPEQRIPAELCDLVRKRIADRTVNVETAAGIRQAGNGGEFLLLTVSRAIGLASTTDGRYFVRMGDDCRPVVGDDVGRLLADRPAVPWEARTALEVPRAHRDATKLSAICAGLRASARVKSSVLEKSDEELLDHYGLAMGKWLTNLGVLIVGTTRDRTCLGSAPVVQAIKYDEQGLKVAKFCWDDHLLSPVALVDAIWREIPDFRESYEFPDGLLRTQIPAFDEAVVRELLVNALVHRPYTQNGDVFLNLHPDRLEVVNAGRLPLGVTPQNILHASRRRNDALARLFHDLGLMEREGSGFDLMYDRLLASGRGTPTVVEGPDSVRVTVPRRVLHPGVMRLISEADQRYGLSQRERIALGLLGQSEGMTAAALVARLEVDGVDALRPWINRLLSLGLASTSGRTRATRYFVDPALLRAAGLDGPTTLAQIQPHRLRSLILEDLSRFPDSGRADIHRRIGPEIHSKSISRALNDLLTDGLIESEGERRWRTYRLADSQGQVP